MYEIISCSYPRQPPCPCASATASTVVLEKIDGAKMTTPQHKRREGANEWMSFFPDDLRSYNTHHHPGIPKGINTIGQGLKSCRKRPFCLVASSDLIEGQPNDGESDYSMCVVLWRTANTVLGLDPVDERTKATLR